MHSSTFKSVVQIIFAGLCCVSKAGFIEGPRNQTVAQGQKAVFTCQHLDGSVGWEVNDTVIANADLHVSADISRNRNGVEHELIVVARPDYNMTKVECIAYLGGGENDTSQPVFLIIQGPLDPVTNIMRVMVTNITWHPPFSLDLTMFQIDILYCIKVTNITSQTDELLFERCNISTPYYVYGSLRRDGIYEITIVSYSNGNSPRNSISAMIRESNDIIIDTHVTVDANDMLVAPTNTTAVDQGREKTVNIPAITVPVMLLLVAIIAVVLVVTFTVMLCKRRNPPKKSRDVEKNPGSTRNPTCVGERDRLIQETPLTSHNGELQPRDLDKRERYTDQSSPFLSIQRKLETSFESGSNSEEMYANVSHSVEEGEPKPSLEGAAQHVEEGEPKPSPVVAAKHVEEGESKPSLVVAAKHVEEGESKPSPVEAAQRVVQGEDKQIEQQASGAEGASGIEHRQTEVVLQQEINQPNTNAGNEESPCIRSPVAEANGELDEKSPYVTVTPAGVQVREDHSAESRETFVIPKRNSVPTEENKDAKTTSTCESEVPHTNPDTRPHNSDLIEDYKAEAIHNLKGGVKANSNGAESRVEHGCQELSPRRLPPKMQAQRAETNQGTTESAELHSKGGDDLDVSGTGISTFPIEGNEEGLLTDNVTSKHTS